MCTTQTLFSFNISLFDVQNILYFEKLNYFMNTYSYNPQQGPARPVYINPTIPQAYNDPYRQNNNPISYQPGPTSSSGPNIRYQTTSYQPQPYQHQSSNNQPYFKQQPTSPQPPLYRQGPIYRPAEPVFNSSQGNSFTPPPGNSIRYIEPPRQTVYYQERVQPEENANFKKDRGQPQVQPTDILKQRQDESFFSFMYKIEDVFGIKTYFMLAFQWLIFEIMAYQTEKSSSFKAIFATSSGLAVLMGIIAFIICCITFILVYSNCQFVRYLSLLFWIAFTISYGFTLILLIAITSIKSSLTGVMMVCVLTTFIFMLAIAVDSFCEHSSSPMFVYIFVGLGLILVLILLRRSYSFYLPLGLMLLTLLFLISLPFSIKIINKNLSFLGPDNSIGKIFLASIFVYPYFIIMGIKFISSLASRRS